MGMGIRKTDEIAGLRDKRVRDKRVRLYTGTLYVSNIVPDNHDTY